MPGDPDALPVEAGVPLQQARRTRQGRRRRSESRSLLEETGCAWCGGPGGTKPLWETRPRAYSSEQLMFGVRVSGSIVHGRNLTKIYLAENHTESGV